MPRPLTTIFLSTAAIALLLYTSGCGQVTDKMSTADNPEQDASTPAAQAPTSTPGATPMNPTSNDSTSDKKTGASPIRTDAEWKTCLTPEQYRILREKGTERAFTGKWYKHKETGMYICAGCGNPLFSSDTKFDSGTGWPSYWQPVDEKAVKKIEDKSHGMVRTEVVCGKCNGHLGHVFNDGPNPTGQRYCINSASLGFKKKEKK